MSMRIENGNDLNAVTGARASARGSAGPDSKTDSNNSLPALSGDQVDLSGASFFINQAKNLTPADRQARAATVAAQYNSGTYRTSDSEIGRAIVQHYLRGRTAG